MSFNLQDTVPGTWEVSTRVVSDTPVIVERAMYWGTGEQPSANVLENVRFFAYQIQDQSWYGNLQKLIDSHYDLLVVDQTRSVKGEEGYDSKGEVARLKGSGNSAGGNKIVVCYIDVGEAESYRWYWKDEWKVGDPDWIVAPDPDGWDENYPVAFWDEEGKGIMKEAIDGIIEDGYDGIYLDWLEVYSFEPVVDAEETANTQRANRLGEDQGFKTYVTLRPLEALTSTPPPGY